MDPSDRYRGTDRDRDRDKDRDRERGRDRDRNRDTERDRDKERERERDKDRERDRGRDKEKDRDQDKDKEKDKERRESREHDRDSKEKRDREDKDDKDRDRDRDKEKKRKKYSDDESSSSSDDSSDEKHKHKKSKKERKEKRREKKKHKKEKKDKKKKDKKLKKEKKLEAAKELLKAYNVESTISTSDYYNKTTEFRTWLREEKSTYIEDLKSTEDSRRLFAVFVEHWNAGLLQNKYYKGMTLGSEDSATRTKYKWNFTKNIDVVELGTLRDSVDTDSNKTFAQLTKRPEVKKAPNESHAAPIAPIGPSLPKNGAEEEELDDEDRQRLARAWAKKDMKDFQRSKDVVMEELVPKATGRDAVIEKRKMQREYNKKGDDSPEMNESDAMGSNMDDFQRRLAREKEWKAKKANDQDQEYQRRLAEAKAKEDERMAPLRALAQRFSQPHI